MSEYVPISSSTQISFLYLQESMTSRDPKYLQSVTIHVTWRDVLNTGVRKGLNTFIALIKTKAFYWYVFGSKHSLGGVYSDHNTLSVFLRTTVFRYLFEPQQTLSIYSDRSNLSVSMCPYHSLSTHLTTAFSQ